MRIPATFTASDLIDAHDAAEVLTSERFRPYMPGFLLPALVARFRDDTAEALGRELPLLPRRRPIRFASLDDLTSAELGTLWDAVDTLVERFTACMDDPELPRLLVSLRVKLAAERAGRAPIAAAPAIGSQGVQG
jgi:hypothetical protein